MQRFQKPDASYWQGRRVLLTGRLTRPWQHVLEPLGGYLRLAEKWSVSAEHASAFHFGPQLGANRTVRELVEQALRHWPGHWQDHSDPNAPHEASLLNLVIDRAHAGGSSPAAANPDSERSRLLLLFPPLLRSLQGSIEKSERLSIQPALQPQSVSNVLDMYPSLWKDNGDPIQTGDGEEHVGCALQQVKTFLDRCEELLPHKG